MIRGHIWKQRGIWHYEVRAGDTVLHADNGGTYEEMIDSCNRSVAAFRRVLGLGYRLKPGSWQVLVLKARFE